ncbi:MAG TPA: 16S rRNA (guanine(966)-N(2))-methyltransferase RsmD, partial [Pyrinomonadaceae bacterium]|nr:16S rRNA (guanine(966)-N(2))-methyltransferase RsmD [Pyrinomonadaceae bacterium]
MRIIAGEYGGRVLKSPPGNKTRPTSDKLRETLFNILSGRTEGARFLDLCAGTGAVGIEAISRGADFVTFVDRSRKACALIEENLDLLAVPEEMTEILSITAENFTSKKVEQSYDIIYYDPPYSEDYHYVL